VDKFNFEKVWVFMKWLMVWGAIAAVSFGGCSYLNKRAGLENDHVAEQAVEALIEHHTGLEIDLSPEG